MGDKMRTTTHRARTYKSGVYKGQVFLTKHNDREFNIANAGHIDAEKQSDNIYMMYNVVDPNNPPATFSEHEQQFYDAHFGKWLDAQNARHRKKGNRDRIKSMEQVRKIARYAPEEVIFQVGDMYNSINRDTLIAIHQDFVDWHNATYPQCVIIDSAGHFDEATGHFQDRYVWITHDADGNETIGQEQALSDMGYELPNPTAKKSRYNNRKIQYTAEIRAKVIEICESYGLEIEREPKESSEVGLSLLTYKCRQQERTLQEMHDDIDYVNECLLEKKTRLYHVSKELAEKESELQAVTEQLQSAQETIQYAKQLGIPIQQKVAENRLQQAYAIAPQEPESESDDIIQRNRSGKIQK